MAVISTKGSWFNDTITASGISGASAVGISLSDPSVSGGISLGPGIGRQTLKQWFLVQDPGGQLHIFRQIDLGPAGFTGRGVDYSQPSLAHLSGGDPTDKTSRIVYLGADSGAIARNLPSAIQQLGGDPNKILKGVSPQVWADGAISQGFADLSKAPTKVQDPNNPISGAAAIGGQLGIPNPLQGVEAIGNFFNLLTDPHTWLRVIEVLGATALIVFGIAELAGVGQQASPIHRVRSKA